MNHTSWQQAVVPHNVAILHFRRGPTFNFCKEFELKDLTVQKSQHTITLRDAGLMNLRRRQRGIRLELKSCSDHSWRNTVIQIWNYIFTSIQLKPPTTPKRRHCNVMVLCMCQAHYSNGLRILQHQRKISGPNSQLYFSVHRNSEALWTGWNEMVWPSIPPPHWTSLHKKGYIPSAQLLDRSPLSNSASDTVSTDTLLCHSMWKEKLVR